LGGGEEDKSPLKRHAPLSCNALRAAVVKLRQLKAPRSLGEKDATRARSLGEQRKLKKKQQKTNHALLS
jgi:hypothetical protein